MRWRALSPNARVSCKAARPPLVEVKIANPLTVAIEEIVAGKVHVFHQPGKRSQSHRSRAQSHRNRRFQRRRLALSFPQFEYSKSPSRVYATGFFVSDGMKEIIKQLNKLLERYDEFRIQSFDSSRLVLIGCWDLTYHHNVEVEFVEVSYIQCATDFRAQVFRLAKREECTHFLQQLSGNDKIFCFETDDTKYFIAAQNVFVKESLVLHYKPE